MTTTANTAPSSARTTPRPTGRAATANGAPDLVLRQVSKTFPGRRGLAPVHAIKDVSGEVAATSFVSILGPSGCGKSTLLEIVAGLMAPSSGELRLGGSTIDGPTEGISVVFQEDSSLPWRTVRQNVELPLEVKGVPGKERRERSLEALELVGLRSFADARPRELSGGMRQRVAIARALVSRPRLLLMDEPFGALDQQTRMQIGEQLRQIWGETEQTIALVTHDISEAAYLSTDVWVLTERPSVVARQVKIPWSAEPDLANVMRMPEFGALTAELWDTLRQRPAETGQADHG